jgi:sulfonate transport system substrate-binding protein
MRRLPFRRLVSLATLAVIGVATAGTTAACGDDSEAGGSGPVTLRLGYFPNITHAPAVVGVEKGIFTEKLGTDVKLETKTFNAGPAAIEAVFSGALDATYIGPNPTVNAFSKSKGEAVRVISGAASGGVALVVKPEITSVEQLRGKKIATPQLGNTQDVAFLNWIAEQGWKVDAQTGKGDVSVIRTDNKITPDAFEAGSIDGAWVPEPTASKLVAEGGKVLLDEKNLWPGGKFVITNVIVSQPFLRAHPDVVEAVLKASVDTNAWIKANPDKARAAANDALRKLSGKALKADVIDPAWESIDVTDDPLAATLGTEADHAVRAGLLSTPDLNGIYDLRLLNNVLKSEGKATVSAAGLGRQ